MDKGIVAWIQKKKKKRDKIMITFTQNEALHGEREHLEVRRISFVLTRDRKTFSAEGQLVHVLGPAGRTVSTRPYSHTSLVGTQIGFLHDIYVSQNIMLFDVFPPFELAGWTHPSGPGPPTADVDFTTVRF